MSFLANPGVIAFILFVVLLLLNFSISVAVGLASVLAIIFTNTAPATVVQYVFSGSLDSFTLLATPLFVMVGAMMTSSGISSRLVGLAQSLVGSLPGGLAITTIVGGCILGSISGSNVATVAALSFMIPPMIKAGYSPPFAVATVAAGCTFGVVIPPSMGFIIYGVITDTSVPKLFASGIIPGLMMAAVLSTYIYFYAKKRDLRGIKSENYLLSIVRALRQSFWGLLCPVIIIGGIYVGIFTPTEAAAVAAVYTFFVGFAIYRNLKLSDMPAIIFNAGQTVGVVILVIATSALFGWILQTRGLAVQLAQILMNSVEGSKTLALLGINIILVIAGAFIEPVAAMYMLLPIFKPILSQFNIDMVHFGAAMQVNLSMAHLTPPVGLSLYLASQIGGVPFAKASRAVLPFIACELVVVMLVTYIPGIALFLPSMMR